MALLTVDYRSHALNMHADVKVFLPDASINGKETPKYKVLWLLHGGNGDSNEWVQETSVIRYAQKYRDLALVIPSTYSSFSMDMAYGGSNYLEFLSKELPAVLRYMFPLLSDKTEDNFVAGASMGGYGAAHWAFNSPGMFSRLGSFAGALDMAEIYERYLQGIQLGGPEFIYAFGDPSNVRNTKNDVLWLAAQNIKNGVPMPKIWALCGRQDFGFAQNVAAINKLKEAGCDVEWHEDDGIHSYDLWDAYLERFLKWLPLTTERSVPVWQQ